MTWPGPAWTREEVLKLKTLAQRHPPAVIARQLNRTVSALVAKAHELRVSLRLKERVEVAPSGSPEPGPAGVDLSE